MQLPAALPTPPYYAVIFASVRNGNDPDGYDATAVRMIELAQSMPGFLGVESLRGDGGFGITVSYWKDEESIRHWQAHAEHRVAQARGRADWYSRFELRVCRVERAYGFSKSLK